MLGLGMRLPRKARDKTRTLHVCFVCELMNCCVMVCMPCCMYDDGCVLVISIRMCWKVLEFYSL